MTRPRSRPRRRRDGLRTPARSPCEGLSGLVRGSAGTRRTPEQCGDAGPGNSRFSGENRKIENRPTTSRRPPRPTMHLWPTFLAWLPLESHGGQFPANSAQLHPPGAAREFFKVEPLIGQICQIRVRARPISPDFFCRPQGARVQGP